MSDGRRAVTHKHLIMRADEKLTAFMEPKNGNTRVCGEFDRLKLHGS